MWGNLHPSFRIQDQLTGDHHVVINYLNLFMKRTTPWMLVILDRRDCKYREFGSGHKTEFSARHAMRTYSETTARRLFVAEREVFNRVYLPQNHTRKPSND